MSLPSTLIWSFSGSALEPSSVIVRPFTVTRPCRISCSALRRDVIPAPEMIFCKRPSIGLWLRFRKRGGFSLTERCAAQLLEFLEARQLAQVIQSELYQKLSSRFVQN